MSDVFGDPFSPPPAPGPRKEKIAAGIIAIFLGWLGIHKFYLGGKNQRNAAIVMLLVSIFGSILLFAGPFIIGLIAFIEGIIILTKDDEVFQREYVQGDRAWF